MGVTNQSHSKDLLCNMNFYISKKGIVQINPIIDNKILYKKSHGSGTTGKIWLNHHFEFCNFVSKYNLKNAIEIGSGSGEFIRIYNKISKKKTLWHIFEPNPSKTLSKLENTKFYKKFFLKKKFAKDEF